jgi:mycofactocin precursor
MMTNEETKELQENERETNQSDSIFCSEEIEIEEMAIDGICGVY